MISHRWLWFLACAYLVVGVLWLLFADTIVPVVFPEFASGIFLTRSTLEFIKFGTFIALSALVFVILGYLTVKSSARVDADLRNERALHRALQDTTEALCLVFDTEGKIVHMNRACEHAFGYALDEVKGKYAWDLFVPADEIPAERAVLEQIRAGQTVQRGERVWLTKDQQPLVIMWNATAVKDHAGNPTYIVQTGIDSTEVRSTRQLLQEREDHLKALNANMSDLVLVLDNDGNVQNASASYERILGYAPGESPPVSAAEVVHPSEVAALRAVLAEADEVPREANFRFRGRDEQWHSFQVVLQRLPHSGNSERVLLTARDVTRLRQAEDKIAYHRRRLQTLTDAARAFSEMTLDYTTVVAVTAQRIGEWLGDACIIYLLTPDQKWLKPVAHYHPQAEALARMRETFRDSRRVDETISGRSVQASQSLLIQEVSRDTVGGSTDLWQALTSFNVTGLICVPLSAQGRTIGVLEAWRTTSPVPFSYDDQALLEDLAHRTALAISNARLVAEAEHRLNRLQALRNIDMAITSSLDLRVTMSVFLDQVTAQLRVDAASILLLNTHLQMLEYGAGRGFRTPSLQHTHLRLGEGHAGRAALERRMVTIGDLNQNQSEFDHAPQFKSEEFVSYCAVPFIAKGYLKGVMELFSRSPLEFDREWVEFVEALANEAAIAMENAALFDDLQRSNIELTLVYDRTLEGWVKALDLRDRETEGHTQRVTDMTLRFARALRVSDAELVHFRRGALLHDIGKIGIPDAILLKPGKLTDEEREIMRLHPTYAYEMLSPITFLRPALDIPYAHHEKWDGSGYPLGLKGEQIPLAARIFALADVWDALTSDRPYHPAWPPEQAREFIRSQTGIHFDPQVVRVMMELGLELDLRRATR